ncbi:lamin tail domain-containing protein [Pleurocapsales cyanobacterium LEGE 10410]|nr:lamin tail domain-containing protein [Pleurocapsales cyanobacterium LEGE 10410]
MILISEYIEGSSNNKAIELYNNSDSLIDLGTNGYTLEFYFNGSDTAQTVIELTGTVASGDVFVVADDGADPAILAQTDQTSTSSFFNGDDAIVLRDSSGVVDSLGQVGFDPGSEWGSGEVSTQNNTLRRNTDVTAGDTDPNNAFDPGAEYSGFPQDTFDGLGTYDGSNGGNGGGNTDLTSIYDIQGAALISPLNGSQVTTAGIVTAVDSNGFYLQDPTGDDNTATSDGIFVFTSSAPGVSVGDKLEVAGTVSEFTPGGASTGNLSITQISGSPTINLVSSNNPLPDAVIIGRDGRIPPDASIDDNPDRYNPDVDGLDFFESLEGMLVTAQDAIAVSGTTRFGEIFTVVNDGASATGISDRGTLNISPDDFNPKKVQIDENSDILPGFDFPSVDTGANLGDVTGVVGYSFGNFEIYPTQEFNVTPSGLSEEITNIQSGDERLTVASYNVLNLDPNDSDGDTDIANGRYQAIANDIVDNLNTPDIIGLQEIQDNSGSVDDGTVAADANLQRLVEAIAANGGPQYEFIDNTFIENNASGGQPGGNIRTAFLYDPNRVDLVEGSVETISNQDPGSPFDGARLPLVADFEFNDQEVTVVNNHFSSKGGSSPIFGVDQPFEELQENPDVNGSLDERIAQAQAVNDYVEGILANDADANIAVLGDLNEFEFISPVDEILGSNLTNLVDTLPENERYSFIFQGNSQVLDHILISDSLVDGAEFDIVYVNSEFAETPQRASDHDPILASFNLPEATVEVNQVNGTNGKDDLVGTNNADSIFSKNGKDILSGLDGNDFLSGGNGKDTLIGGDGDDTLEGGNGKDTFVIAPGQGSDVIEDFGNDLIGLANGLSFGELSFSGSDILFGDEVLATLTGVDATTLTESDFTRL